MLRNVESQYLFAKKNIGKYKKKIKVIFEGAFLIPKKYLEFYP